MAGITHLALKKIDLIFPGEHEMCEREFVRQFITQPSPELIYAPGLDCNGLLEFCSRCDFYGIPVIGFEFKDTERIPIESYSWEEFCEEYTWEWIRIALLRNQHNNYGRLLYPVVDITNSIIRDYLQL